VFQVVSIQTTTGFGSADFNLWPFVAQVTLVALMFVGGSAGSTDGGIKVIRLLMAFKIMVSEIEKIFRPNVVRPIKVGSAAIDSDTKLSVMVYIIGIILLSLVGGLLITIFESGGVKDGALTGFTASIASINNIGPGLAKAGAIENYAGFTAGSKWLMCLWMALGRLEIYALLVLFAPRFWRGD